MNSRTLLSIAVVLSACTHSSPRVDGVSLAPVERNRYWTSPPSVSRNMPGSSAADTTSARAPLSLATVVDLALRNNPATRISWSQARAAADRYGASRGARYPLIEANLTGSASRTTTSNNAPERMQIGPSVSLSYLVMDFGGRNGAIESARATAATAGFEHNASLQATILAAESAAFSYLAARAVRDAQRSAVEDVNAILAAAEERHRVGFATIADVYQARTAAAQDALDLETFEGQVNVARGTLAVVMGLPPTTSVELADLSPADSATVAMTTASVDSIMSIAVQNNPVLAAANADTKRAEADRKAIRSAAWPSLTFGANGGYLQSNRSSIEGRNYALTLGLSFPLFTGFATSDNTRAATEELNAAVARAQQVRQQVELQVFASYFALQTATKRVRASADLLANAEASERVARGRYSEGVGGIVDVLLAQSALSAARAQSLSAGWEWRIALSQLAHDTGALGINGDPLPSLGVQGNGR